MNAITCTVEGCLEPVACVGLSSEGRTLSPPEPMCSVHCGHGNEDSVCVMLDDPQEIIKVLRDAWAHLPDDLRAAGWSVAGHEDSVEDGIQMTTWRVTKSIDSVSQSIYGDGESDAEALNKIREHLKDREQNKEFYARSDARLVRRPRGESSKSKQGVLDIEPNNIISDHRVVMQAWEESERSWGVRPDGITLHLTRADRDNFCKQYWAEERKRSATLGDGIPDEYTRESGEPVWADVDAKTYGDVLDRKRQHGLRLWQHELAGRKIKPSKEPA